ncbi:hypothetical protein CFIO01_03534 [Colletotrichum fioriniae PJ7]|uniref:Uncharacterized protein n=1 Tax=Colletotrichum fioriniae PJ7 TaxID=1445577 RepID=A0A010R7E8_9PEZI|nr:hypothetical protein CFIO01_03534 [Colletotrichum fioriniae PJ7]
MHISMALVAGIAACAAAIPVNSARTIDTVANELACVARGDMACAGIASKRTATDLANELACVARGDMACAGHVEKRDPEIEQLANELSCVARGDMACAGLASQKRAVEAAINKLASDAQPDGACLLNAKSISTDFSNELCCAAQGDMACAGLVAKKRDTAEVANELACVARGDMACAGVVA